VTAEEPTTPDLVELVRRANDAFDARDIDAWLSFFSPDIVYRPVSTFTDSQERLFQVIGFREGQIALVEDFTDRDEALKAAGVDE